MVERKATPRFAKRQSAAPKVIREQLDKMIDGLAVGGPDCAQVAPRSLAGLCGHESSRMERAQVLTGLPNRDTNVLGEGDRCPWPTATESVEKLYTHPTTDHTDRVGHIGWLAGRSSDEGHEHLIRRLNRLGPRSQETRTRVPSVAAQAQGGASW